MNWQVIAMIIGAILLFCVCVIVPAFVNAETKNDDPEWLYGRKE